MATLETQYKNFLIENPTSKLSYDDWMNQKFIARPEVMTNLKSMTPPYVSDNFQIGSNGAFEMEE
jgi:hypothetical protein